MKQVTTRVMETGARHLNLESTAGVFLSKTLGKAVFFALLIWGLPFFFYVVEGFLLGETHGKRRIIFELLIIASLYAIISQFLIAKPHSLFSTQRAIAKRPQVKSILLVLGFSALFGILSGAFGPVENSFIGLLPATFRQVLLELLSAVFNTLFICGVYLALRSTMNTTLATLGTVSLMLLSSGSIGFSISALSLPIFTALFCLYFERYRDMVVIAAILFVNHLVLLPSTKVLGAGLTTSLF